MLEGLGERRPTAVGEYLYRSGEQSYDFFVVASGAVDIVVENNGDGLEQVVTRHGAGKFLGERRH